MATYKIKAPDGNSYRIEGPDGASEEEIQQQVLAQHPEAAKPKAPPKSTTDFDAALKKQGGSLDFFDNLAAGAGKWVDDTRLGGQQAINAVTGGRVFDKAALAQEAAGKEHFDKQLMDTGGGMIGKYGMDVASTVMPYAGLATKSAKLLPNATGYTAAATRNLIPGAVVGAGQEVLTPDENYNIGNRAVVGALKGAGGDLAGRAVGRVLSPIQGKISKELGEHLDNLKDVPNKLLTDLTESKLAKSFTNALSMTPAGAGVNAARRSQAEAVTEKITGAAGLPVKRATPSNMQKLEDTLKAEYDKFDAMPDVKLTDVPEALQPTLDALIKEAQIAGSKSAPGTLRSAIEGSMEVLTPAVPSRVITTPTGKKITLPGTPAVTQPTTLSAKQLLDLRSRASNKAMTTDDQLVREANMAVKDALEDSMFNSLPAKVRADFKDLNAKWSTWERIKGAGVKGEGDTIRAEDYLRQLSKARQLNPRTDLDKMVVSADRRMPTPSLEENRSLMTRGLMAGGKLGTVGAVGGAGMLAGLPGVAGVAGSLALAHALLGTPAGGRYFAGQAQSGTGKALQSESTRELLRLLGFAEATN